MNWYIVRLNFKGPLHIGRDEAGIGVEGVQPTIHSDTLFSAFCNVWANTGRVEGILKGITSGKFPFRLSSAFFYRRDVSDRITYFLPRPMLPLSSSFGNRAQQVKQTDFLTLEQFEKWAKGRITTAQEAKHSGIGAEEEPAYLEQVRPRHASDRETMASSIYHCGEIFFGEGVGLYFLAETSDKELLEDSLRHLSFLGLGGERSLGYGAFRFEVESITDSSPFAILRKIKGNACYLLSLYYPDSDKEIKNSALAYRLVIRKGWFYSSMENFQGKRLTCRMFSEGSVFSSLSRGCLLDVAPDGFSHSVYRSGVAMSLPINLEGVGDA